MPRVHRRSRIRPALAGCLVVAFGPAMSSCDPPSAAAVHPGAGFVEATAPPRTAARATPSAAAIAADDSLQVAWRIPYLAPLRTTHARGPAPEGAPFTAEFSEAPAEAARRELPAGAPPEPLTPDEALRVLASLPPIEQVSPAELDEIVFAEGGGPAGARRAAGAPGVADADAPGPAADPLEVVVALPLGDAEIAADLTVIFSHPMVALGAEDAVASPATLDPQPEGEWLWLDPRTLRFRPRAARLPGGIEYRLHVRAGTRAHDGSLLEEAFEGLLRIRGPLATGGAPNEQVSDLEPRIVLAFDEVVTPDSVAAATRLELRPRRDLPEADTTGVGTDTVRVVAVPLDEADSATVALALADRLPGQVVALAPERPLTPASEVELLIGPELRAAGGTVPTGREQTLRFRTMTRMAFIDAACRDPEAPCRVPSNWGAAFTNPLHPDQDWESLVSFTPRPDGLHFGPGPTPNALAAWADFDPHTTYRVRIEAGVRDAFGAGTPSADTLGAHFGRPAGSFQIPGNGFITLAPGEPPRLEVPVRGMDALEVVVFRMEAGDWEQWAVEQGSRLQRERELPRERDRVWIDTISVPDAGHGFTLLDLSLEEPFERVGSQALVVVSAPGDYEQWRSTRSTHYPSPAVQTTWIQSVPLDVWAATDEERIVLRAVTWEGEPVAGAEVHLPATGWRGRTDADGFVAARPGPEPARVAEITTEAGPVILPLSAPARIITAGTPYSVERRGGWSLHPGRPLAAWAVRVDRDLYQPGEPMALQGWVREVHTGLVRDLKRPERIETVRIQVESPRFRGVEQPPTAELELTLSPSGAFATEVQLPDDLPAGQALIVFEALDVEGTPIEGWTTQLRFRVQEFRRPDYAVALEIDDSGRFVQGGAIHATVAANYFDGPGLPGAEVTWDITARLGRYFNADWREWRFGRAGRSPLSSTPSPRVEGTPEGRTDLDGRQRVRLVPRDFELPFSHAVVLIASVQDANRQVGTRQAVATVRPAEFKPAVRLAADRLAPGEPVRAELVYLDPEGTPVDPERLAGLRAEVERVEWVVRSGWEVAERRTLHCDPAEVEVSRERAGGSGGPGGGAEDATPGDGDGAEPAAARVPGLFCESPPLDEGSWLVVSEARDAAGRTARTESEVLVRRDYVSGAAGMRPDGPRRLALPAALELTPDREEYEIGDTARVEIAAPFPGARGVALLLHNGIRRVFPLELPEGTGEVRIPLVGAPGLHQVEVHAYREGRGQRHTSTLRLFPNLPGRRLDVQLQLPESAVPPGGELPVRVEVRDDDGRPVPDAEVAMWLVDEAVLSLGGMNPGRDPYADLHHGGMTGARVVTAGLHGATLWPRAPRGPGRVSGRVLDAGTGRALLGGRVRTGDGLFEARIVQDGEFELQGIAPGRTRLEVEHENRIRLRMEVEVPDQGLDVGHLVTPARWDAGSIDVPGARRWAGINRDERPPAPPQDPATAPGSVSGVYLQLRAPFQRDGAPEIELPAPPSTDPRADLDAGGVAVREDFMPLGGFEPSVMTDTAGIAETELRLPHTITTYRVVAVAMRGAGSTGRGEGFASTARTLRLRLSLPQVLRVGDRAELPFLLQNDMGADRTVEVALRSSHLEAEGSGGVRLRMEAGERREVRIPVRAVRAGEARVQIRTVSGGAADAVSLDLTVLPPMALRAAVLRTEIAPNTSVGVPLEIPDGTLGSFGGLELRLSTSLVGGIGTGVGELTGTRVAWPRLRIGRIRLAARLAETDLRFEGVGPAEVERLEALAATDLHALRWSLADYGAGRLGLFRLALTLGSFDTGVALDAIAAALEAERIGLPLADRLSPGLRARLVADAEARLRSLEQEASPRSLFELAYIADILHRDGVARRPDVDWSTPVIPQTPARERTQDLRTSRLFMEIGEVVARLPVEIISPASLARLAALPAGVLVEGDAERYLAALRNRAVLTGGSVTFRTGEGAIEPGAAGDDAVLLQPSSRREDARVLLALSRAASGDPLIEGLVRGLVLSESGAGARPDDLLLSALVLSALVEYGEAYEGEPVDARVRTVLGGRTLSTEHLVSGRPRPEPTRLALRELRDEVGFEHEGQGRVFGEARLEWSPVDPFQPPEERGFIVRRSYEGVDDPDDVKMLPDGSWQVQAGARVRIRVELVATARRTDVLLHDPIPGGLEPLLPGISSHHDLADPDGAPLNQTVGPWWSGEPSMALRLNPWWRAWYRERTLDFEAMSAWGPSLPPGVFSSSYLVRATTPGTFVAPGARAWEASRPDVRGRGAADRVVVVTDRDVGR